MGTQSAPEQLFYDFDLDEHVPANHMLREIDRFLDVDGLRTKLRTFYSHLGRPSIDPELIVRMLVKRAANRVHRLSALPAIPDLGTLLCGITNTTTTLHDEHSIFVQRLKCCVYLLSPQHKADSPIMPQNENPTDS